MLSFFRAKFDIGTKKAEEVKKIKKADMIQWCSKYFNESSPECRRLNVRFWGANTSMMADDSESEFDRIEKFKRERILGCTTSMKADVKGSSS